MFLYRIDFEFFLIEIGIGIQNICCQIRNNLISFFLRFAFSTFSGELWFKNILSAIIHFNGKIIALKRWIIVLQGKILITLEAKFISLTWRTSNIIYSPLLAILYWYINIPIKHHFLNIRLIRVKRKRLLPNK